MALGWIELITYFAATGVLLLFLILINKKGRRLPPGPVGWPIIGNLLELGDKPHQSLFLLAQKYGPLMTLKMGSMTTLVVSSPSMTREVLKNNDLNFSSRPVTTAVATIAYNGTTLMWSPYSPRWRFLRKITNTEIFSVKRLEEFENLRREVLSKTMESIYEDCQEGKTVNIGAKAFMTSLSLVGRMVCSKDVLQRESKEALEFKDIVWQVLEVLAITNVSDLFPFLKSFDLQGLNGRIKSLAQRFESMFDKIIEERLANKSLDGHGNSNVNEGRDFLEVLMNLKNDGEEFTLEDIKGLLTDMFIAGTDTTSGTIEWAMSELLRNPHILKRIQDELDEVVGKERRMEESDIANLPYLHAVVKETLRLHPVTPLLLRKADKSCEIGGYYIPENTRVFVNIWGNGRDPTVWEDPLDFKPDRFVGSDITYRGHDFELPAFGAGRRICIGLPLAHRIVHLVVGSLVQSFNWSIPNEDVGIDMSEKFGLTLLKAIPLMAIASPRISMKNHP